MKLLIVDKLSAKEAEAKEWLRTSSAGGNYLSYKDMIEYLVKLAAEEDDYDNPDPARITEIDHGDYQGTLVYVIGGSGYQPFRYWYVVVGYGSCSGCDELERCAVDDDIEGLYKLLHDIASGFREMNTGDAVA
jgi:hypothetical protein